MKKKLNSHIILIFHDIYKKNNFNNHKGRSKEKNQECNAWGYVFKEQFKNKNI